MLPLVPAIRPPGSAPFDMPVRGTAEGAVMVNVGRHSRELTLTAFYMIGGVERFADWADKNPGEFYTKLFKATITREVEVTPSQGIEDLIRKMDSTASRPQQDYLEAEVVED